MGDRRYEEAATFAKHEWPRLGTVFNREGGLGARCRDGAGADGLLRGIFAMVLDQV